MTETFIEAEVTQNHTTIDNRLLQIKEEKEKLIEELKLKLVPLNEEQEILMKNKNLIERSVKAIINVLQEHAGEALGVLYIKKRVYKRTNIMIEMIEPLLREACKEDQNIKFLTDGRVLYKLVDYKWYSTVDNLKEFIANTKCVADYLSIPTQTVSMLSRVLENEGYSFNQTEKRNSFLNSTVRHYNEKHVYMLEQMKNKKEENPSFSFEEIAVDLMLTGEEKEKRLKFLNQSLSWNLKQTCVFVGNEVRAKNYFDLLVRILDIVMDNMPDKMNKIENHRHFPLNVLSKRKSKLETKSKKNLIFLDNGFYLIKGKSDYVYKDIIKYILIELDIPFEELSPIITIVKPKMKRKEEENITENHPADVPFFCEEEDDLI